MLFLRVVEFAISSNSNPNRARAISSNTELEVLLVLHGIGNFFAAIGALLCVSSRFIRGSFDYESA